MRQRILLLPFALLVLLLTVLACDSANPVAPGGTVLTVTANPTLIGLAGETSTITITGFRPDGNPLNPGTQITLSTSLGTLRESTIAVGANGVATAFLTGNGQQGEAMVTVTTPGSDSMAMVTVQIGESDTTRPQLTVTATPSTLSLNEPSDVSVVVRNADGSSYTGGGDVRFETSLGELSETLVAIANGRAATQLLSGDQVGTATVTAFFGSAMPTTVDIAVENQRPTLIVTINPDDLATNEDAVLTILARDENGLPLGSGLNIQLFSTLGSFPEAQSGVIQTDSTGRAVTKYNAGDTPGTADITAILENSEPVVTMVSIRGVINTFQLLVSTNNIDRPVAGGMPATLELTARTQNALGEPVPNVTINFESEVGGTFTPSATVLTGGTSGSVTVTLSLTDTQLPSNITSFEVSATAAGEVAPGVENPQTEDIAVDN